MKEIEERSKLDKELIKIIIEFKRDLDIKNDIIKKLKNNEIISQQNLEYFILVWRYSPSLSL